jgi:membrane-associated phospholipid phosphatase
MPLQPIVAPARRRATWLVVALTAAVVVAMSVALHDVTTTSFDTWATREFAVHIGEGGKNFLLGLTTPAISMVLLLGVAVVAALARRWEIAALAVIGPSLALGLTELVLKPVVHRWASVVAPDGKTYTAIAFPSGHETGLVSLLVVVALLVAHVRLTAWTRAAVLVLLVLWALLGAVGLTRGFYHYATDTIGGMGVALVCVLGVALVIDHWGPTVSDRWLARSRQFTRRS